jgi:hypothetical protein
MQRTFMAMLLIAAGLPWMACSQQTGPEPKTAQEQSAPPTAQQEPQTAQDQNAQNAPSAEQPEAALQIAEGDLTKVDAKRQMIWIKTSDGREMRFLFNNETQVEGADKSVEGLANTSGSHLTIHFKAEGPNYMASRIEVQTPSAPKEKRPGSTATPKEESPGSSTESPGNFTEGSLVRMVRTVLVERLR